eukprot:scaffold34902_cov36-Prasinocladus_malaysianus.AAC.1
MPDYESPFAKDASREASEDDAGRTSTRFHQNQRPGSPGPICPGSVVNRHLGEDRLLRKDEAFPESESQHASIAAMLGSKRPRLSSFKPYKQHRVSEGGRSDRSVVRTEGSGPGSPLSSRQEGSEDSGGTAAALAGRSANNPHLRDAALAHLREYQLIQDGWDPAVARTSEVLQRLAEPTRPDIRHPMVLGSLHLRAAAAMAAQARHKKPALKPHAPETYSGRYPRMGPTGFLGVLRTEDDRYVAYVTYLGMTNLVGRFDSEVEAAVAYDKTILSLFGPAAGSFTNFGGGPSLETIAEHVFGAPAGDQFLGRVFPGDQSQRPEQSTGSRPG